jgi:hypothetical protein
MLVEKRDLKIRTRKYALAVIHLFSELPKRTETQVLGRHLLRSGTSLGTHYREATLHPLSFLCLRRALPFIDIYFPAFGLR